MWEDKNSKSPEVKCEQREANNERTTHSYEDTWLGRWSGTPALCKSYGDGDVELSCVSVCNPVSWIMRREFLHSLSLKHTHVEKKIFGEKKFSSPRRIFCHVNRFSSDEDRERDGALVSRIEDSCFSLLSVVHSSFPAFLRTNCASWLRISIRIECNLWSSEQIGFKRAREGGRERRAGGGIEEQFSFVLIACCWSGVVVATRCLPLRELF